MEGGDKRGWEGKGGVGREEGGGREGRGRGTPFMDPRYAPGCIHR